MKDLEDILIPVIAYYKEALPERGSLSLAGWGFCALKNMKE